MVSNNGTSHIFNFELNYFQHFVILKGCYSNNYFVDFKVDTGEGPSRNDAKNEQAEERHLPNEVHNDLDEGFIDECESTHSNPRVFEKSPSGSQDVQEPNASLIIPENTGPNKALLKSAGRAFRY